MTKEELEFQLIRLASLVPRQKNKDEVLEWASNECYKYFEEKRGILCEFERLEHACSKYLDTIPESKKPRYCLDLPTIFNYMADNQ